MEISEILKLFVYLIIGSGVGTFLAQKLFEHRLNKKLSRFNELYSNKLNIIRKLYKLLIKAEKAVYMILSQDAPRDDREQMKFNKNVRSIKQFIDYFDENEIVFDVTIIEIVNQMKERLKESKEISVFFCLVSNSPDEYEHVEKRKLSLWEQLSEKEFPILKMRLKADFQKKFGLLEN